MNVFATYSIDESGDFRAVVLDKQTRAVTMRTPWTYATRDEAVAAAESLISELARA